ncbi:uncharacterized protein H6S33_004799 [Morchella sextelata]|uniref:uncharacterized protein n=1 Tax=Morchella sextelata TaxID=1174677 RepID=UPI001D0456F3|nr:uncharacterized protein H6S33_004799 [Morchella sextelata]KAH0605577.1 hypothetical protein H6S33_004799 [Morchella sextelata]
MFGAICAGRAVQTNIQAVSDTQFIFHLPSPSTINHLVVFLLPEAAALLPPTHGATVHIQFPNRPFQLLGAISLSKPSAIFRLRSTAGAAQSTEGADGMMDGAAALAVDEGEAILGISVEPLESVQAQVAALEGALVVKSSMGPPPTTVLARRIIKDAFNFLSSFATGSPSGDVVPLKSFQDWWVKFEKKIEYDPTFLERDDE